MRVLSRNGLNMQRTYKVGVQKGERAGGLRKKIEPERERGGAWTNDKMINRGYLCMYDPTKSEDFTVTFPQSPVSNCGEVPSFDSLIFFSRSKTKTFVASANRIDHTLDPM